MIHPLIESKIIPEPNSGCWLWLGSLNGPSGYAFGWDPEKKKNVRVSRYMMEKTTGTCLSSKILVCHTCDTPSCVNPEHLFVGTHDDNSKDKCRKGRQHRMQGEKHPLSKITEVQVMEIRSSTDTLKNLSQKYGLHLQQIFRIRKGLRWGHLKSEERMN